MLKERKSNQYYVEPFCGGCNTFLQVGGKRLAGDKHVELIAMYKALQKGWEPPKYINEDDYKYIKQHGTPELKGYVGFTHSFGGKFFGTYRRHPDKRIGKPAKGVKIKSHYENMRRVGKLAYKNMMEMAPLLKGIKFECCNYYDLEIPPKSLIYCDPPYAATVGYGTGYFSHTNFWEWCRNMVSEGHKIFVSEYRAPKDFKIVWQKDIKVFMNNSTAMPSTKTEKLFTL